VYICRQILSNSMIEFIVFAYVVHEMFVNVIYNLQFKLILRLQDTKRVTTDIGQVVTVHSTSITSPPKVLIKWLKCIILLVIGSCHWLVADVSVCVIYRSTSVSTATLHVISTKQTAVVRISATPIMSLWQWLSPTAWHLGLCQKNRWKSVVDLDTERPHLYFSKSQRVLVAIPAMLVDTIRRVIAAQAETVEVRIGTRNDHQVPFRFTSQI